MLLPGSRSSSGSQPAIQQAATLLSRVFVSPLEVPHRHTVDAWQPQACQALAANLEQGSTQRHLCALLCAPVLVRRRDVELIAERPRW